jgi:hypothetical protein
MPAPDEISLFAGRLNAVGADYMGGSTKHPSDIRAILATSAVDQAVVTTWAGRLGIADLWESLRAGAVR